MKINSITNYEGKLNIVCYPHKILSMLIEIFYDILIMEKNTFVKFGLI